MFYANTYLEYGTRLAGILLAEQMQKWLARSTVMRSP